MFKFLLKLLGVDQFEYPEYVAPIKKEVKVTAEATTAKTITEVESVVETNSQEDVKATPKTSPEAKTKPVPKTKPKPKQAVINTAKQEQLTAEQLAKKLPGLKLNYATTLIAAGYDNMTKLKSANDKELVAIKGIGKATVQLIRKNL